MRIDAHLHFWKPSCGFDNRPVADNAAYRRDFMTGLAQKNGAVVSHVRIADTPEQLYATRIAAGEARLVLACDILTGVGNEALAKMQKGVTRALVNTSLVMPAQFTREPDLKFPTGSMEQEIKDAVGAGDAEFLDATKLATGLMGDSIATNLFMMKGDGARRAIRYSVRPQCRARDDGFVRRHPRTR